MSATIDGVEKTGKVPLPTVTAVFSGPTTVAAWPATPSK
jgi:hypothetical protein